MNHQKYLVLSFLALLASSASASDVDVNDGRALHYFTPPHLDKKNMGEQVYCVRPMYSGSLDLTIETHSDKNVITISGFGGSGITLGEGAVDYQISEFEKKILPSLPHDKDTEISVLGMGWIGSLTALKLTALGYKNVHVIADNIKGLTSHNAGGLIAPVSMANNPEQQKLADQFGIDAYKAYRTSLKGNHPFINAENGNAVMLVPTYFGDREDSGLEPYVKANVMKPAIDVSLQMLGTDIAHDLVCYEDGIFVNTPSVLDQFHHQIVHTRQIPVLQKVVKSFKEVENSVIFNCTGVRAADLSERFHLKKNYVPTLGHLIMGQKQEASAKTLGVHNSMILTYGQDSITEHGHKCTDSFYSFPKHYGDYQFVLGGTFIKGVQLDQNGTLIPAHRYEQKMNFMWDNARQFYGKDSTN